MRACGQAVHRLPLDFKVLDDAVTRLTVTAPAHEVIPCAGHLRTGLTSLTGLSAPLVYVGKAFPDDLNREDVRGSIVLAYEEVPFEGNSPSGIRYLGERVQDAARAGAVGLVFADYRPDDLIVTWGVLRDLSPIPCVAISYPSLCQLRPLAERGDAVANLVSTAHVRDSQSDVISAGPEGPGDRPLVVLLGTHYETVPTCPGANDNASSLAIVLELARVFSSMAMPIDLLYIATVGEEAGSFGALDYVERHSDWLAKRAIAVLALDQVAGNEVPLSAHGTTNLNRVLMDAAAGRGYVLRLDNDSERPRRTGLSDARPFFELGIPSIYLGGWTSDLYYHTAADTPDKVNPNALKVLADILALAVLELARLREP
jgi:aminopeptidase YwaD